MPKKLLVIAGEASGDLHAGSIINEFLKLSPDTTIIGTGGAKLAACGAELYYDVKDLAVIGIWEVLKRYGYFKQIFDDMVAKLDQEKPDAVLLIDYPGFNLRFAAEAKKRNIRVIFYVAPQVWAWKKNRIHKIKQYIDELIVLFPFEVAYFKKANMPTRFFGNPLLEVAKSTMTKVDFFSQHQLDPSKTTVSLLPGSRKNEIIRHLPLLIDTIKLLKQKSKDIQLVIPLAPTVDQTRIEQLLSPVLQDITLIKGDTYNLVGHSDFALVASGIATLETAVLETPMIIYYKISAATYLLGKYVLKIKTIGLPNIVAEKPIIDEFINDAATPEILSNKVWEYLKDMDKYQTIEKDLRELKQKLGTSGAYQKTATFIHEYLNQL